MAVASAWAGYRGAAELIIAEQLTAHKVARLFSFSLRRRRSHDLRGAGNDAALVIVAGALVRIVLEPAEPDMSEEWAIATTVSRRRPSKLFRDARRIIETNWADVTELVGVVGEMAA
jgi:hypothetical protein